ncbi:MAG TPA: hypothetical protein VHX62_08040 [Solirubrobacteraceae bacterium]|jgi:hypothetical protein|nr:hypothetical protein [Solirubrobacteraceae bacterium]
MTDESQGMIAFLGVAPDPRLLDDDLENLPGPEQRREAPVSTQQHDRLVAAGSVLTGVSLIGGVALLLYGAWRLLFEGGGALDAVVAAVGLLLAATHWGWVHVAEYVGLTIDGRQAHEIETQREQWLATIEPYPRFSVGTSVGDDGSTHVRRFLHRPVLTDRKTFTFVRESGVEHIHEADAPAEVIAEDVETMRRQARLQTDRMHELWDAASTAYAAALLSAHDDQERLAAQRAAAVALSEHINASLEEAPLVE